MMLLFLCTVSSLRETKKLGRRQAVSVHLLPTLEIERVEVDNKMGPQCSSLETRGKKWDPIPWRYSFFLLLFVCFVPWHTVELLVWVVLFCRSSTVLHFHGQDPPPDSLAIGGQALMWWLGHVEWYQLLSIVHLCDTASHSWILPLWLSWEISKKLFYSEWSRSYHQHHWISLGW